MADMLDKVRFTREEINARKLRKGGQNADPNQVAPFAIQVDGGIDDKSGKLCVEAGANVLVSGTYLFGAPKMKPRIEMLRGLS